MAISHDAAARALYLLCYQDDSEVDGYVERFISRYGSLSLESARAALAQSDSFDHVFAIFLLGLSAYPTWQVHLRPYLTSADPWEQWSSVLCLGAVHDPAAFPLMCDLLTAQFPADPKVLTPGSGYLLVWRPYLARLLGAWGSREAVVPLRHALVSALELDEEQWNAYDLDDFTDEVVFALGRLKAVGALTGIVTEVAQLDLWRIHLIVGSVYGRDPMPPGAFRKSDVPSSIFMRLETLL
ncbi:MAG TPA: hypothetical protein VHI51_16885, partial [Ktedonobacterales bacterium]|nr:hypothetical protein [Ktedonobacterales bacterium]